MTDIYAAHPERRLQEILELVIFQTRTEIDHERREPLGNGHPHAGLGEIRLADMDIGLCALVGCYGIVQIQLAGSLLLVQGLDSGEVTLCLESDGHGLTI